MPPLDIAPALARASRGLGRSVYRHTGDPGFRTTATRLSETAPFQGVGPGVLALVEFLHRACVRLPHHRHPTR